jgi:uncharacterized RDD family membrane protein YckC
MSSVDKNDERYAPPRAAVSDVPEATDGLVLATRGRRLAAAIVDVLVSFALIGVLALVTPWNLFADTGRGYWRPSLFEPALGFVLFMLANGYLLATQGQTIGKRLLGLRIVRSNGSAVAIGRMIGLRYGVFSALNIVPVVGQVVGVIDALCIFRSSRRCLHDDLADTLVIKA